MGSKCGNLGRFLKKFEENNQNDVYKNWKQTVLWRETQLQLLQKVFESVWKLLSLDLKLGTKISKDPLRKVIHFEITPSSLDLSFSVTRKS